MNRELYITLCFDKPQKDRENRNLENSVELWGIHGSNLQ